MCKQHPRTPASCAHSKHFKSVVEATIDLEDESGDDECCAGCEVDASEPTNACLTCPQCKAAQQGEPSQAIGGITAAAAAAVASSYSSSSFPSSAAASVSAASAADSSAAASSNKEAGRFKRGSLSFDQFMRSSMEATLISDESDDAEEFLEPDGEEKPIGANIVNPYASEQLAAALTAALMSSSLSLPERSTTSTSQSVRQKGRKRCIVQ